MSKAMYCALAGAAVLTACGGSVKEEDLTAAISQNLAKKAPLCLGTASWPVDINEREQARQQAVSNSSFLRMQALAGVGLVSVSEVEVDGMKDGQPDGSKLKARRYVLSDAAKPYLQPVTFTRHELSGQVEETKNDLCWGKTAFDKLGKWEANKQGEQTEVVARYHYKVDGLAPWASNAAVQSAFPKLQTVLSAAGKKENVATFRKTATGLEAANSD